MAAWWRTRFHEHRCACGAVVVPLCFVGLDDAGACRMEQALGPIANRCQACAAATLAAQEGTAV